MPCRPNFRCISQSRTQSSSAAPQGAAAVGAAGAAGAAAGAAGAAAGAAGAAAGAAGAAAGGLVCAEVTAGAAKPIRTAAASTGARRERERINFIGLRLLNFEWEGIAVSQSASLSSSARADPYGRVVKAVDEDFAVADLPGARAAATIASTTLSTTSALTATSIFSLGKEAHGVFRPAIDFSMSLCRP